MIFEDPKGLLQGEADAINLIMDHGAAAYAELSERYGPVGRTLSRLIRPVIAPLDPDEVVVSTDYSAIEARVLPFLAEDDEAEEIVLDVFRECDADPTLPDIYQRQAGLILVKDALEITKAERQSHGKVPVLSLGFGGGKGALFNMARNYGVYFMDDEAAGIVSMWREANPWARRFWDALWEAANLAMQHPGEFFKAGRIHYVFDGSYLGGTLSALMPDGRALHYPGIKWEERELKDKLTGKTEVKWQMTYRRAYGRSAIWYGTLAENVTQGFAASLLRDSIRTIEEAAPGLLNGHTHDELIAVCKAQDAAASQALIERHMLAPRAYTAGLPLNAETTISPWYTKTLG